MQQSQRTLPHSSQWAYANGQGIQMQPRNLAFDPRTRTMTTFGSPLPSLPIAYSPALSLPTSMSAAVVRGIEADEDYNLGGTANYYDSPELHGSHSFTGELLYSSNSYGSWEKANVVSSSASFKQGYTQITQLSPSNSRYLESSTRFDDTTPAYVQTQRYASEGYTGMASHYSHSRTPSFEEEFSAGIRLGHQRDLSNGDDDVVQQDYYGQEQQQQPIAYVQPAEVAEHQYGSPSMSVQALLPEADGVSFPTTGDTPSPLGYASSPGLTSDKDDSLSDASGDDEDGEYDPADSDYDGATAGKAKSKPGRARRISGTSIMSVLSEDSQARPHRRRATRAPAPVPIANLTKKSRGRRVPTSPMHVQEDGVGKNMRPHVCPAENCFKRFGRTEHLKRHVRSIHTDEKPHQCPAPGCHKTFSRHDNLNQHMRVHKSLKRS